MASVLFTIGGAVVNALATNFVFSRVADHEAEECERHDSKIFKKQGMNGIEIK